MFLIPYGNHAQLGDGSATERLMSALAYGWVECCNDVVGCRTSSFQDKYLCVKKFICIFLMKDDEHASCVELMNYFRCIIAIVCIYVCFYFNAFLFIFR